MIGSSSDSSVIVSSIGSLVIYKVLSRVLSDRVLSRFFSDRIIIRVLSNVLFWVHSDSVLLRQGRRKLFYFLWWGTENKCQPPWLTNEKKLKKTLAKKRLIAIPQKTKFGQKYKLFKISHLEFFF